MWGLHPSQALLGEEGLRFALYVCHYCGIDFYSVFTMLYVCFDLHGFPLRTLGIV